MTRIKRITLAFMTAASVLCLMFAVYFTAFHTTASAEYATVEAEYLDIDGTTLRGFKSGATLPQKINLVIPDEVTAISANAFAGNNAIVRVVLNERLQAANIGADAFANCNSLVEVYDRTNSRVTMLNGTTLGMYSTSIGRLVYSALNVCYDDAGSGFKVTADGYMFCKDTRTSSTEVTNYLVGYVGEGGALSLPAAYPDTAESYNIYQYAFWSLGGITSVEIPEGVKAVGNYAFYSCADLESVVLPASSLITIGSSAFQGSAKITSITYRGSAAVTGNPVNLPEGLQTIGVSAFSGLVNINSIFIPASVKLIDIYAFENCTSGAAAVTATATIVFAAGDEPLTINRYAFYNCSGLRVIELPQRLTTLYARSFAGCTALAFAYLPDDVNYTTVSANETSYFEPVTTLIYSGFAAYDRAVNLDYISSHISNMTYTVNVNFRETDEANNTSDVVSEKRLYGYSYRFVQSADLSWANVDSVNFPVQSGYSKSVWYLGNLFDAKADIDVISGILRGLREQRTDNIDLFARLMTKPSVSAVSGLIYDENTSYSRNNIKAFINTPLSETEFTSLYSVKLNGNTDFTIADAGNYHVDVGIADEDDFGVWLNDVAVTIVIGKKPLDIGTLRWNMDTYNTGVIYLYENANGDVYPAYTRLADGDIPAGFTYSGAKTVYNSIVRYRGTPFDITLNPAEHEGRFTIDYSLSNVSTEIGEHVTTATLVAGRNYQLVNETTISSAYGVTININEDECTITKVWYIVEIRNGLYTASDKATEYAINGWSYGAATTSLSAPVPEWGANSIALTFTLYKNGTKVGDNFDSENFSYYVNSSMPADIYELSVFVPSYDDYTAYTQSYTFAVESNDIDGGLLNKIENEVKGRRFVFAYDGEVKTYDKSNISLDLDGAFEGQRRSGIWATAAYNEYYSSSFEISYNLARMFSNSYYTEDELENTRYKPVEPGTYTLYFQISANNFSSLADVADDEARRAFSFEVVIYGTQELPVIADAPYTGESIRPEVPSGSLYTVDAIADGAFVDVNTYNITLTLNDPEHYVWAGRSYSPSSDGKIQIPFRIVRADNEETRTLNLIRWSWGSYSEDNNIPIWDTRFPAEITYKLVSQSDGKTYNYENGDFATAPAGNYTFSAYAKGYVADDATTYHYNWNALQSGGITVTIARGVNRWTQTPNIDRWRWGEFDEREHRITATPLYIEEEANVKFSILDGNGKTINSALVDFGLTDDGLIPERAANLVKTLNAGDYLLVAKVASTGNYSGLDTSVSGDTPMRFEILQATNHWEVTPNIVQWNWGSYDKSINLISAKPAYGTAEYRVYTRAASGYSPVTFENGGQTYDHFVSDENGIVADYVANVLSKLDAGTYYLRATVKGSDVVEGNGNYSGLNDGEDFKPLSFVIQRVNDYWEISPNIVSWSSGNYDGTKNAITAVPAYGADVAYIVKDADGNEYGIDKIASLKEGEYTLTATSEGTVNYSGLQSTVSFRVFGETDTSFMSLQIGAVSVMGLTIAALVAVAVVMLLPKKGGKK